MMDTLSINERFTQFLCSSKPPTVVESLNPYILASQGAVRYSCIPLFLTYTILSHQIVMWGGECARQQRPYGTIGVVGLGSRARWGVGSGRG